MTNALIVNTVLDWLLAREHQPDQDPSEPQTDVRWLGTVDRRGEPGATVITVVIAIVELLVSIAASVSAYLALVQG